MDETMKRENFLRWAQIHFAAFKNKELIAKHNAIKAELEKKRKEVLEKEHEISSLDAEVDCLIDLEQLLHNLKPSCIPDRIPDGISQIEEILEKAVNIYNKIKIPTQHIKSNESGDVLKALNNLKEQCQSLINFHNQIHELETSLEKCKTMMTTISSIQERLLKIIPSVHHYMKLSLELQANECIIDKNTSSEKLCGIYSC